MTYGFFAKLSSPMLSMFENYLSLRLASYPKLRLRFYAFLFFEFLINFDVFIVILSVYLKFQLCLLYRMFLLRQFI